MDLYQALTVFRDLGRGANYIYNKTQKSKTEKTITEGAYLNYTGNTANTDSLSNYSKEKNKGIASDLLALGAILATFYIFDKITKD